MVKTFWNTKQNTTFSAAVLHKRYTYLFNPVFRACPVSGFQRNPEQITR